MVLVAEHVDLAVGVVANENAVTDGELGYGLLLAGLEFDMD